jgi:hypothetical protein
VSNVASLAAAQATDGRTDADGAVEQTATATRKRKRLEQIMNLPKAGVSITDVRSFGQGSNAAVEIDLSNGETMQWDSIRDMTRPQNLAAEVIGCAGATPKLNQVLAQEAAACVWWLAKREATHTDNSIATDWGTSYLQAATTLDLDMTDQAERWEAFCNMADQNPLGKSRETGMTIAAAGLVLRHIDGTRFVRCGWFHQHVRTQDAVVGQTALAKRLARVGWTRNGSSGRIRATAPGRQAAPVLELLERSGWVGGSSMIVEAHSTIPADALVLRARKAHRATRVEEGIRWNGGIRRLPSGEGGAA